MCRVNSIRSLSKIIKASTLTLFIALLSGCGHHFFGASHPNPGPCIAEIDVTSSVRAAGLLKPDWFNPFAVQVANGCPNQTIYAGLIGANTQAGTCPTDISPAPTLNGNQTHDTAVEASRRSDLAKELQNLLECGFAHPREANGTDLFGAFMSTSRLAAKHSAVHVYILSDMVEDQGRWNFYNRKFDAVDNNRMLSEVREASLVPVGLKGAEITVVGIGVGASSIPPSGLSGMYNFWHLYFAAAGASLDGQATGKS